MNKRILLPLLIMLGLLLAAGGAVAAQRGPSRGPGMRGPHPGQGRIVYGEIIKVDATQIVVKPQIPERLAERLAEAGIEPPELPDQVIIGIDDDTRFYRDGEESSWDAFAPGDIVVVGRAMGDDGPGNARRIADEETAREFLRDRLGPGGPPDDGGFGPGFGPGDEGPGWGGEGGPGGGWGPSGEDSGGWERGDRARLRERMRPAFGEITALSEDSVTIKPEVPDFIQAMLDERGIEPPDLPDKVTMALTKLTRFMQDSEPVDDNPFQVGDHVALMAGPDQDGGPAAWVMCDYSTAQNRMEKMRERFGPDGPQGPGGPDDKPGGQHGHHPGPRHGGGQGQS
jgi:hypothetical protein